jgi:hypothetical protein
MGVKLLTVCDRWRGGQTNLRVGVLVKRPLFNDAETISLPARENGLANLGK